MPKIVKDFIIENKSSFRGKKIFIICTMGLFSGDGADCSARLFKKFGVEVVGGLHLKMPDCIGDKKILKKSIEGNRRIIQRANEKIHISARRFKEDNPTKEGPNFVYHIAGLLGQRLWFFCKTAAYKNKPNVDEQKCSGCGRCVPSCPMNNIEIIIILGAIEGIAVGSFVMFSIQFLLSMFFGRSLCGYICPVGGLQECLTLANNNLISTVHILFFKQL